MEIVVGLALFAGIAGLLYVWEHLKERGGATTSALSGIETAGRGVGWVVLKVYAVGLIAFGIFSFTILNGGAKFIAVGVVGYGVYLLFGGAWVIY